jgi:hypothetical protein
MRQQLAIRAHATRACVLAATAAIARMMQHTQVLARLSSLGVMPISLSGFSSKDATGSRHEGHNVPASEHTYEYTCHSVTTDMKTYKHTNMHKHTHTNTHTHTHTHTHTQQTHTKFNTQADIQHMYINTVSRVHTDIRTQTQSLTQTQTQTHRHRHTHTCTYTHVHEHIHTTHACTDTTTRRVQDKTGRARHTRCPAACTSTHRSMNCNSRSRNMSAVCLAPSIYDTPPVTGAARSRLRPRLRLQRCVVPPAARG